MEVEEENTQVAKQVLKFLEMEVSIRMSYLSYLTFYLLMRTESVRSTPVDVQSHPVVMKLAQIRTMLESMEPIREKVDLVLTRLTRKGKKGSKQEVR